MHTFIIGSIKDTVHFNMKCVGIKACYLLSTGVRTGGSIHLLFTFDDMMRQLNLQNRINYIQNSDKDKSEDFNDLLENHTRITKLARKKIKYRDKNLIALQEQLEKAMNTYFEIILKENLSVLEKSGMYELRKLIDKPAFGFYNVNDDAPEKEDDDSSQLSNLLQLDLDEKDNEMPFLFFLNYDLFSDAFAKGFNTTIPTDNILSENGFLTRLLSFGNINIFSVADIGLIKSEYEEPLGTFQQAINDFAKETASPQNAFDILNNTVIPAANTLQKAFDNSVHFKNTHSAAAGIINLDIYAGLLPSKTIYSYFEFIKAATEETLNIVNALPGKLMPVIALRMPTWDENAQITAYKEPAPLSTKKSLNID